MGTQTAFTPEESQLLSLPAPAPRRNLRRHLKRGALAAGVLGVVLAAATFGTHYWTTGQFEVTTDDAYVAADSTAVAPKVSGYIKDVLVADNQTVRAGQVLARIDNADFQTALQQASAKVASARADITNLEAQIAQQLEAVSAARSNIVADQAVQKYAEQDQQRYADLLKTGYGTVQRAQQTQSSIRQANAAVQRDQANLASAVKQSDVLRAALAKANAVLAQAQAEEAQASLNFSYTTISAPVDGTVGARAIRVGAYVQAGTQLMQVVPLHQVYITANYKETQLTDVQPGQPVTVQVDTFPGVKIVGHVDSLSPASGQEFALLPADNATGNFTKIVQRIPVKIALEAGSEVAGRLRPGMSVEAVINTKDPVPSNALASN